MSFIVLLIISPLILASEPGNWEITIKGEEDDGTNIWSDYSEAKPDMHPDAWLVKKLVGFEGQEIMLKSSAGAMLRWVSTTQLGYLHTVQSKIESVSELESSLYIVRGDTPNASAGKRDGRNLPALYFAMLDMIGDDLDLWAALLGHEIAHLKLSHGDKRAKRNLPLNVLKSVGAVVIPGAVTRTASSLLIDGFSAKFNRDAERQSDYMGVIWATQASYDPYGAYRLHVRMNDISSKISIPFLGSHPSGPERIKTLEALAKRLSK